MERIQRLETEVRDARTRNHYLTITVIGDYVVVPDLPCCYMDEPDERTYLT